MSKSDAQLKVIESIIDAKGDNTNAIVCQNAAAIESSNDFW